MSANSVHISRLFTCSRPRMPASRRQVFQQHGQKGVRERARHCLDELRERAREVGVPCETFVGSGVASQTILDTIASKQIDLAVLGTNGLHGFERFISRSTAEEVLRKSPCPVMTVGPRILDAAVTIVGPVRSPATGRGGRGRSARHHSEYLFQPQDHGAAGMDECGSGEFAESPSEDWIDPGALWL